MEQNNQSEQLVKPKCLTDVQKKILMTMNCDVMGFNTSFVWSKLDKRQNQQHLCSASRFIHRRSVMGFGNYWDSFLRESDEAQDISKFTSINRSNLQNIFNNIGADDVHLMTDMNEPGFAKGKCFIAFMHLNKNRHEFICEQIEKIQDRDPGKKQTPFVLILVEAVSDNVKDDNIQQYEKDVLEVVRFVAEGTKNNLISPQQTASNKHTAERIITAQTSKILPPVSDPSAARLWGSVRQSFWWSGLINIANFVGLGVCTFSIGLLLNGTMLAAAAPALVAITMVLGIVASVGLLFYAPWKMYEHFRQWDYLQWKHAPDSDISFQFYRLKFTKLSLSHYWAYLKDLKLLLSKWITENKVQFFIIMVGLILSVIVGVLSGGVLADWLSGLSASITQLLSSGFNGLGLSFLSIEMVTPNLVSAVKITLVSLIPLVLMDNMTRLMRVYDDAVEAEKGDYCIKYSKLDEGDEYMIFTASDLQEEYRPEYIHSATQAGLILFGDVFEKISCSGNATTNNVTYTS